MDCLAKSKFLKKIKKRLSKVVKAIVAILTTRLTLVKLDVKLASLKLENSLELLLINFLVLKLLLGYPAKILKNPSFFLIKKPGIWTKQLQFLEEITNCLQDFPKKTNLIKKFFVLIEILKHTIIWGRKVL